MSYEREVASEMKIKNFIMSIWELPQNVLGFIVKKVCKAEYVSEYKTAKVYRWKHKKGHIKEFLPVRKQ